MYHLGTSRCGQCHRWQFHQIASRGECNEEPEGRTIAVHRRIQETGGQDRQCFTGKPQCCKGSGVSGHDRGIVGRAHLQHQI